jgi:hypothetical protein
VSGVYPYCLVPVGCEPPRGLRGVGEGVVEGRDVQGFTVWTSEEPSPPSPNLESIVRHDAVVRAAAEAATPLPVRFGAWAPHPSVLVERINRRRAQLEAALTAVSGRTELGVTVEGGSMPASGSEETGDAATEPVTDGRAYLRKLSLEHADRRRRRAERLALLEGLRAALGALALHERVHPPASPALVSVAHLVPRRDEARYRQRVARFARDRSAYRVRVTGPWPPYSFASP